MFLFGKWIILERVLLSLWFKGVYVEYSVRYVGSIS